jgi:transketolase N-terminal domain/subunit
MNKEKTVLLNKKDIQYLKEKAAELRKYIILMNCYSGSGHPGGSLSAVEIITYLFHHELNFSLNYCPNFSLFKISTHFVLVMCWKVST